MSEQMQGDPDVTLQGISNSAHALSEAVLLLMRGDMLGADQHLAFAIAMAQSAREGVRSLAALNDVALPRVNGEAGGDGALDESHRLGPHCPIRPLHAPCHRGAARHADGTPHPMRPPASGCGPGSQRACPDGGTCHHGCAPGPCFRVKTDGPLSGAYPDDEWPEDVRQREAGLAVEHGERFAL